MSCHENKLYKAKLLFYMQEATRYCLTTERTILKVFIAETLSVRMKQTYICWTVYEQ